MPGIAAFDGGAVVLADGSRVEADAAIAATGYRRDLEPLVGHLGALGADGRPLARPVPPDLHFIGFGNPFGGNLRALGREARTLAATAAQGAPAR